MKICKKLNPKDSITSVKEWFTKCPPTGKAKQWVDGRSAKETAKHWLKGIPKPFIDILKYFNLKYILCSPEYVSKFDNLDGNSRNHDLLIKAQDENNLPVIISVESKVDEAFGIKVGDYWKDILSKKATTTTNADIRIKLLKNALFINPSSSKVDQLRYQLLTAIAGTLSESKKQKTKKAIFVVQTFISSGMDSKKYRQNQHDLDYFLEVFTYGKHKIIHDGNLVGPFTVPGNDNIPNNVELWIGKYSVRL